MTLKDKDPFLMMPFICIILIKIFAVCYDADDYVLRIVKCYWLLILDNVTFLVTYYIQSNVTGYL